MALTWILCGANSIASDSGEPNDSPFAALYEGISPDPKIEYMLARLMILPPLLRLTIDFATNCDRRKEAFKWVSMVLSAHWRFRSTPSLLAQQSRHR